MSPRCCHCAQAAEAICLCEGRPTLMCVRCALRHSEGPGQHEILPLEAEFEQKQCCVCGRLPAESLCLCAFPAPALCADCFVVHSKKLPNKSHFCESLLATLLIHSDEDRQRFVARAQALNRAEAILKANFVSIEKCSLASSERYTVAGRGSEALGDMLSPREKFSPCQWGRKIVLAGGVGTTSVEMLDMDRRTYESLAIRLPAADCTVSVMRRSELVMVQANQLLVCDLDRPTVEMRAHVSEGNWWSNLTPVVHKGTAFFFRLDFSLMFDRGLVDVLVTSFKKMVNIHRASLYALDMGTLTLRDLRDIHY